METAVNKLEAMFQKAEADLEYMEKQMKHEFMSNVDENGEAEENPVHLLKNLSSIKARHKALCAEVEQISIEQKQSVESIKGYLNKTVQLVQELHRTADVEVPPLTEKEIEAAEALGISSTLQESENSAPSDPQPAQPQDSKANRFAELSKVDFEAVPRSVRSDTKLADLNALYKQLCEHFVKKNSRPLSLQQIKKMNTKANEAMLKTLSQLSVIELDKKGLVHPVERD